MIIIIKFNDISSRTERDLHEIWRFSRDLVTYVGSLLFTYSPKLIPYITHTCNLSLVSCGMHTSELGAVCCHAAALVWFHAAALAWFPGPLRYMIYKVSSNPKPVLGRKRPRDQAAAADTERYLAFQPRTPLHRPFPLPRLTP